jgi:hypothetical protein
VAGEQLEIPVAKKTKNKKKTTTGTNTRRNSGSTAAIRSGVYSAFNRNEYEKQKNNVSRE